MPVDILYALLHTRYKNVKVKNENNQTICDIKIKKNIITDYIPNISYLYLGV